MATIDVAAGQSIQAAIDAANPGDTIDVATGTYTNQFLTIGKSLTLQAIGGPAVLFATFAPPNGKAIITEGQPGISVAINGFDISGAVVADRNGAAIRYEGGSLSLSNVDLHNNQEGLLGAADPNGNISIDHSEISANGDGSGSTHNLYVGAIASFSLTNSYVHDAVVGHEVKSRAASNIITGNRIFDNGATASYSVDLPNGGNASITGNAIEQGANTQNPYILAYGEEGQSNPGTAVSIDRNTIVNDDPGGRAVLASVPLPFTSNQVFGLTASQFGNVTPSNTVFLGARPSLDTSAMQFVYPSGTVTPPPPPPPPPQHGHNGHGHGKPLLTTLAQQESLSQSPPMPPPEPPSLLPTDPSTGGHPALAASFDDLRAAIGSMFGSHP